VRQRTVASRLRIVQLIHDATAACDPLSPLHEMCCHPAIRACYDPEWLVNVPPTPPERRPVQRLARNDDRSQASGKAFGFRSGAPKPSATKHLDDASTSISNNIAEGNGKRSKPDRARFLDIACGSAFECVACIDALVVRGLLKQERAKTGKLLLHRVVSMLHSLRMKLCPKTQG